MLQSPGPAVRRILGVLLAILVGLTITSAICFGPGSSEAILARCQIRTGNSSRPVPVYFGGTAHEDAPCTLVPAGTRCHLEHVPCRAYDPRDKWFLVTIDQGEMEGRTAWILSSNLRIIVSG